MVNKTEEDLLLTKSDKFRQRVEENELLDKMCPIQKRMGSDYWQLTLRNPSNEPGMKFKAYKKINANSDLQFIRVEGDDLETNYLKCRHPSENEQEEAV